MSEQGTQNINSGDFTEILKHLNPEEIKKSIGQMTDEQQIQLIQSINNSSDLEWKARFSAAIGGLCDHLALENVGRYLKSSHFLYLLSHKKEIEGANQDKLTSLLVGMPNQVFNEILSNLSENEKLLLQQEAGTEPLQHQLTLFSHEMIFQLEILTDKLREMEREIDNIIQSQITYQILESYYRGIESLRNIVDAELQKINNALALSWNTSRSDLIEALSFQKECRQKYRCYVIGHPPTETKSAAGFYARLICRLNEIFTDNRSPNNIEALRDDEPAIEALVKFSLWYLQDYVEVGILHKTLSELDLNNLQYTDQQRAEHRASLYKEAQKNLEEIDLVTVKDLKEKQIFSKEILKEYIKNSKNKQV